MTKQYTLEGYVVTHEGKLRTNNEDNFFLFDCIKEEITQKRASFYKKCSNEIALAAVYDGMGGEDAGEVAALIAAQYATAYTLDNISKSAEEQLIGINELVCDKIRETGSRMGTTAVQLYFDHQKAVCVNIGDSRAYRFRNGELKQLSVDHSEGQRMINMGIATPEEAKKSKGWHELTQHIGIFQEEFLIEPYISEEMELRENDIFLISSDGLTDMLDDDEIVKTINENMINNAEYDITAMAESLLEKALDAGGRDNITILLVKVV